MLSIYKLRSGLQFIFDDRSSTLSTVMTTLKINSVLAFSLLGSPLVFGLPGPCNIVFDGRIPLSYTPSTFDTNSSVFDDQFVHGESEQSASVLLSIVCETDTD